MQILRCKIILALVFICLVAVPGILSQPPTWKPTAVPSAKPTSVPTIKPTKPTNTPTPKPSSSPTCKPTSAKPTRNPTMASCYGTISAGSYGVTFCTSCLDGLGSPGYTNPCTSAQSSYTTLGCIPFTYSTCGGASACTNPSINYCNVCASGFYGDGSSCTICPTGRYKYGAGGGNGATGLSRSEPTTESDCTSASLGYYAEQKITGGYTYGATAQLPCGAGYYASETGSASCTACPEGFYSSGTGASVCTPANAGYQVSSEASTSQTACTAGKYSAATGAASCSDCPQGKYNSVTKATACTDALAGQYVAETGMTTTVNCPVGTYSDEGASECSPCTAGTYASAEGSSACIIAQPGYYVSAPGQSSAMECPIGKASSYSGATVCDSCLAGTYQNVVGKSACVNAPSGAYSSAVGAITFTYCASGYFTATTGMSTCTACSAGTYKASSSGATSCTLADPGNYVQLSGSAAQSACSPGQYSDTAGNSACSECPQGKFNANSGQTSCNSCYTGLLTSSSGKTSCEICDYGYYGTVNIGGTAVCTKCTGETTTFSLTLSGSTNDEVCKAVGPTFSPTVSPTLSPTATPTNSPTAAPSLLPTTEPTAAPTLSPSASPTLSPSPEPSAVPTLVPTPEPSARPSNPTPEPTLMPTLFPSGQPSGQPTYRPTAALQVKTTFVYTQTLPSSTITSTTWALHNDNFISALVATINVLNKNARLSKRNFELVSSSDYVTRRRLAEGGLFSVGREKRQLAVAGVTVQLLVSYSSDEIGIKNATTAYSTVSSYFTQPAALAQFQAQLADQVLLQSPTLRTDVTSWTTFAPALASVTYEVLKSAWPTSTPTGAPSLMSCPEGKYHSLSAPVCFTCGAGTYSKGGDVTSCTDCSVGKFQSSTGAGSCNKCAKGYYQDKTKQASCIECTYPYTTIFEGLTECPNVGVDLSTVYLIVVGVVCFAVYLAGMAVARKPEVLVFTIFPALDIISDVLYFLQTSFYNRALLGMCLFFIIVPNAMFVRTLVQIGAVWPHIIIPYPTWMVDETFLWLGIENGLPLYKGERMSFSLSHHDTILKLTFYWVSWVVLLLAQGISLLVLGILWLPYMGVQIPFSVLWLFFGFFLSQVKLMAVGTVWTYWHRVWRRADNGKQDSKVVIDTGILNESLFAEFCLETCPQILIQSMNNYATNNLSSGIAIFSIALSVFMAANGVYRYLYFTQYLNYHFEDVPLEIKLGFRTIRLEHATHAHGQTAELDVSKLSFGDRQMLDLDKDRRFDHINRLLKDTYFTRDDKRHRPDKTHLFGLHSEQFLKNHRKNFVAKRGLSRMFSKGTTHYYSSDDVEIVDGDATQDGNDNGHHSGLEDPEDVSARREVEGIKTNTVAGAAELGYKRGALAVDTALSWMWRDPFGTVRSALAHTRAAISEEVDAIKTAEGYTVPVAPNMPLDWIDELDLAVAEFEIDGMPVLNDMFVFKIMRAFKRAEIESEADLHEALRHGMHSDVAEQEEFIADTLGLRSQLYALIIKRYFAMVWERMMREGKGPDYEYPKLVYINATPSMDEVDHTYKHQSRNSVSLELSPAVDASAIDAEDGIFFTKSLASEDDKLH